MSRTVAIVQARMTSTRLPGKVMAELCGRPLLTRMVERVRRSALLDDIVIATTVNPEDDGVASLAADLNLEVFRGDEHDVLGRYRAAADRAGADAVVRLTADCPMIDPQVVDDAVRLFHARDCDYASNACQRTYPDGLDVEVIGRTALQRADEEARHSLLREHVTPYINGKRPQIGHGDFRCVDLLFEADFSHVRWTVDEPADLERVRRLVSLLPDNYTWLQALAVATREPSLLGLRGDDG